MTPRLILVEGLPGSGKTTAAEAITHWLAERGIAAAWWREEDAEHPATPRELRRTAASAGFADRCLASWEKLALDARGRERVLVLEGAAFQSTIRFMLENDVPRAQILAYVRRFDDTVSCLAPRLVHLWQADPRRFLEEVVYPSRGPAWVAKVASHLASTPCCRARGWQGARGMSEFWLLYRDLCEEALTALRMPVLRAESGGQWSHTHSEIFRWLSEPR